MTLGEFLRKERNKRNLSQEQMAEALGFSRSYYSALENDYTYTARSFTAGTNFIKAVANFTGRSEMYIKRLANQKNKED